MMTVKQISDITGISVRTLHYYDEIGLLRPTQKSEAGYRLYDDKALEQLQQILFFREFDIPLKEINVIMQTPAFDRISLLKTQRKMLESKKLRLERLIESIDDILKGENKMDFAVFNKTETEEMFDIMVKNMPEELRQKSADEFDGLEKWKAHYLEVSSSEKMQKGYLKMIEWYGSKADVINAMKNPPGKELVAAFNKRVDRILKDMYAKKDKGVNSFEIKQLVGEYGFVMKKLFNLKDEREFMLTTAKLYEKDQTENTKPEYQKLKCEYDRVYGAGAGEFFAAAIYAFYKK